jgi:nitrogen fixation/metabolism regulation signal transduction histidine kinase
MPEQVDESGYRYYISVWLPAAVLGVLLVLVLVIQLLLSWRAHTQLAPVNPHLTQMNSLQVINLELQRELLESLNSDSTFTTDERSLMRDEIEAIIGMKVYLSDETPAALARTQAILTDAKVHPREALILALTHLRKVLDREASEHTKLIGEITRATAMELKIGVVALLVFPACAILLIYLLRRRILEPLKHLGFLMNLLQGKKYAQAPVATIDPLLRPLSEDYNAMVTRLAELEDEHAMREQDLEVQVENATRVLLEQQRSLANTERLAAVGETMARIAHELRNPLAGVKMSCTNLRKDLSQQLDSPEYVERIDIVAGEIDRIIALLNSMLDQTRHRPEALREVPVARTVRDIAVLASYQVPAQIHIEQQIDEDIVCRLPDALFRQALLNLLLNATQALGDAGGRIVIRGDLADGDLHLVISDNGPGFPGDLLDSGIRAFVTYRTEGTGLGLSMVQRFARSLGGRLRLSNLDPHGARVTLELPCGGS